KSRFKELLGAAEQKLLERFGPESPLAQKVAADRAFYVLNGSIPLPDIIGLDSFFDNLQVLRVFFGIDEYVTSLEQLGRQRPLLEFRPTAISRLRYGEDEAVAKLVTFYERSKGAINSEQKEEVETAVRFLVQYYVNNREAILTRADSRPDIAGYNAGTAEFLFEDGDRRVYGEGSQAQAALRDGVRMTAAGLERIDRRLSPHRFVEKDREFQKELRRTSIAWKIFGPDFPIDQLVSDPKTRTRVVKWSQDPKKRRHDLASATPEAAAIYAQMKLNKPRLDRRNEQIRADKIAEFETRVHVAAAIINAAGEKQIDEVELERMLTHARREAKTIADREIYELSQGEDLAPLERFIISRLPREVSLSEGSPEKFTLIDFFRWAIIGGATTVLEMLPKLPIEWRSAFAGARIRLIREDGNIDRAAQTMALLPPDSVISLPGVRLGTAEKPIDLGLTEIEYQAYHWITLPEAEFDRRFPNAGIAVVTAATALMRENQWSLPKVEKELKRRLNERSAALAGLYAPRSILHVRTLTLGWPMTLGPRVTSDKFGKITVRPALFAGAIISGTLPGVIKNTDFTSADISRIDMSEVKLDGKADPKKTLGPKIDPYVFDKGQGESIVAAARKDFSDVASIADIVQKVDLVVELKNDRVYSFVEERVAALRQEVKRFLSETEFGRFDKYFVGRSAEEAVTFLSLSASQMLKTIRGKKLSPEGVFPLDDSKLTHPQKRTLLLYARAAQLGSLVKATEKIDPATRFVDLEKGEHDVVAWRNRVITEVLYVNRQPGWFSRGIRLTTVDPNKSVFTGAIMPHEETKLPKGFDREAEGVYVFKKMTGAGLQEDAHGKRV
ncbi:MAG: hypothetical protein ABIE84_06195, partial [bacterium]